MKTLSMPLVIASITSLSAAHAASDDADWIRNTGPYVGLEAGANFLQQQDKHEDPPSNEITNTSFHTGFAAGLVGGYAFRNRLRPELELSHRRNKIKRSTSTDPKDVVHGFQNNDSLFGNLWYDVPVPALQRLHPYFGGGVGGSRIDSRTMSGEGPGDFQTVFAGQAGAGIGYDVAPHFTVSADYRYVHTRGAKLERSFPTEPENGHTDYIAHTAMVTLRYAFGVERATAQPKAVPVAEPAPPPAPLPEPRTVTLQTVNFQFDADALTPAAKRTLDDVALALRNQPSLRIEIEGSTDSLGSERYNMALSQRRANAVRDYLVGRGVPAQALTAVGLGESKPVASNDTPEGRAQNRRADLAADPANLPADIRIRIEGPTEESRRQAEQRAPGHKPDPGMRKR